MRIAFLGTRGVPAQYGGFETAVEEVGSRLAARGHEVTVYCRNPQQRSTEHRGMRLINLPAVRLSTLETLSHMTLSTAHAVVLSRPDVALVFNAANAPLLPILKARGIPTAVHIDGLEWQRAKWSRVGQQYYRWAERSSVRRADAVIVDARGIQEYIRRTHGRSGVLIAYGAPIVTSGSRRLAELALSSREFHLVVARWEPENHVDLIIDGYRRTNSRFPLVVVGDATYSARYRARVLSHAAEDPRIQLVGAIWDQDLLNELYGNALTYLHGHSVGGTNPSLLRALGAGAPVSAFDVVFNREVTDGHSRFFSDPEGVTACIEADERDVPSVLQRGEAGREFVSQHYTWKDVADAYEQLCFTLQAHDSARC